MMAVRTLFHPFLPNGPAGDPAVWVDLQDEGQAVGYLTDIRGSDRNLRKAARLVRGVQLLICEAPFHFSPRYEGRHEALIEEAGQAFGGPVVML
jgi:ribonuclease BN (tRNA processing enzyme)